MPPAEQPPTGTSGPSEDRVGPPQGIARPPGGDVAILVVALLAVSTSAPIIAACAAPKLAIAFWRNAFAVAVLLPVCAVRGAAPWRAAGRSALTISVVSGGLLAAHFATWVPSLSFTSVASSTALVATQPVWAALIASWFGEQIPGRAWAGIVVAVAGAATVSGIDFAVDPTTLWGDLLALLGGMFAAAYVTAGARARQTLDTTTYTTVCYSTCAVVLLPLCLVAGRPLAGYDAHTWAQLAGLTLGAQLLGHSLINRVLRTTSPTVVSLAILFEVPGATLIAALFLGVYPPPEIVPAVLLLIAGVALVITAAGPRPDAELAGAEPSVGAD